MPAALGAGALGLGALSAAPAEDNRPNRVARGLLGAGALGLGAAALYKGVRSLPPGAIANRKQQALAWMKGWEATHGPKPPMVAPGYRPPEYYHDLRPVVRFDRVRNSDGQFEPGTAAPDPGTMTAAYHPDVANLIAASHRRRQRRDLVAGGVGAGLGLAAGAAAMPAWAYLRSVMQG